MSISTYLSSFPYFWFRQGYGFEFYNAWDKLVDKLKSEVPSSFDFADRYFPYRSDPNEVDRLVEKLGEIPVDRVPTEDEKAKVARLFRPPESSP